MSFALPEFATSPWADGLTIEVVVPPVGPPPIDPGPNRAPPITGLRIMTPIPPFPQYPSRADPPEEFMLEGDAFLAHFPTFRTAANTVGTEIDAAAAATALHEAYATDAAVAAAAYATTAASVANYKGPWIALAGALAIPASVSYSGKIWALTESVANVAAEIPGTSPKWVLPYPIRRLNIFETTANGLTAASSGESVYASFTVLGLASSAFIATCGTGAFVVSSSAAASTVQVSTDNGVTWVSKAMPASAVWRVMGHSAGFFAFAEGQTGALASAISNDNGVTWTARAFAGTWGSTGSTRFSADPQGTILVAPASTASTVYVSTNSGVSWSAVQTTPIASPTATFAVAGTLFIKVAGTGYQTSTTGLTGSWTSRTLPGACDTLVLTEGTNNLLAYKAGSLTETAYIMNNVATMEWLPLGQPLWASAASLRTIGSSLITATGSPMECATAHITGTDQRWIPRSAPYAIDTTRHVAQNGAAAVVVANNAAYRIPYGAGLAPLGMWE